MSISKRDLYGRFKNATEWVNGHPFMQWLMIISTLIALGSWAGSAFETEADQQRFDTEANQQRTEEQDLGLSFDEYWSRYEALSERFVERDEFVKRSLGKRADWAVSVRDVSSHDDGSVTLYFYGEKRTSRAPGFAGYPPPFQARVLSLRVGDRVRVKGILHKTLGYPVPVGVQGESLDFLSQAAEQSR